MDQHGAVRNPLSKRTIFCALAVAGALGAGFLERGYANALAHERRKAGSAVEPPRSVTVMYDGIFVGDYCADLLVEQAAIVELKTVPQPGSAHRAQCLNDLRATGLHLCLLPNLGTPRLEVRRIVHGL